MNGVELCDTTGCRLAKNSVGTTAHTAPRLVQEK